MYRQSATNEEKELFARWTRELPLRVAAIKEAASQKAVGEPDVPSAARMVPPADAQKSLDDELEKEADKRKAAATGKEAGGAAESEQEIAVRVAAATTRAESDRQADEESTLGLHCAVAVVWDWQEYDATIIDIDDARQVENIQVWNR